MGKLRTRTRKKKTRIKTVKKDPLWVDGETATTHVCRLQGRGTLEEAGQSSRSHRRATKIGMQRVQSARRHAGDQTGALHGPTALRGRIVVWAMPFRVTDGSNFETPTPPASFTSRCSLPTWSRQNTKCGGNSTCRSSPRWTMRLSVGPASRPRVITHVPSVSRMRSRST